MNNKIKIIIGIIILTVFIGIAYFSYNYLSSNYKPDKEIKIEEGQAKNQLKRQKTAALDFRVLDYNGNEVKLSDFFGKPIVLNFWASWCPPCKSEMPHFDKVYKDVKNEITFLMVDLIDGQRETIEKGKKHISDNGYSFPVYFDITQEAASAYEVYSIPSTLFIDKDGYIVTGYQGAIDENTLLKGINLLNEQAD